MRATATGIAAVVCCGLSVLAFDNPAGGVREDTVLRAMSDELARAKTLQLNNLDKPYFVSYTDSDNYELSISGSLGGITGSNAFHIRRPHIQVRVGAYAFDNTNSIYSGFGTAGLSPVDQNYQAIRTHFWLATDNLYKLAT
ncbi:MAG: hypothetical protein JOZ62_04650, partial [Acidobacteriaceae bacterium]|nr:hypothetical protein [Acidobacteriaceae bacterium]